METIRLERDGDVLVATIDHPDSAVNAVDGRLHHDLGELFRTLKTESAARAIVLTGAGKAFSAGGDMAWFPTLRTIERAHALRREGKQIIWDLLDVEVPIVCGLNGSAAGLGASIALLCDVIVMADAAVIVDPHVKVGLVAGDGGAAIWPLLLGPLAAKRHLLLGDPLTAADAAAPRGRRRGLPGRRRRRPGAWPGPRRLAAGAPLAVQGTKQAVNAQIKQALLTSFDVSMALEMPCFLSADHAEAVDAFVDRPHADVPRALTSRSASTIDSNPTIESIMTTRAIRRFTDEPVTDDELRTCLRAAQQAPSGGNVQPQQYLVVTDPDRRRRPSPAGTATAFDRYEASLPEPESSSATRRQAASWRRTRDASRHLADHLAEAPAIVLFLQPLIPWTPRRRRRRDGHRPARRQRVPGGAELLRRRPLARPRHGADDGDPHPHRRGAGRRSASPEGRFEIAALVPVGRPAGSFGVAPRKPADAVTHWDRWGDRRYREA